MGHLGRGHIPEVIDGLEGQGFGEVGEAGGARGEGRPSCPGTGHPRANDFAARSVQQGGVGEESGGEPGPGTSDGT